MTLSQTLSELGLHTPEDTIPDRAFTGAKALLLDALGCALAARKAPGTDALIAQMLDWAGKPEATVLFTRSKLPAPNAACANSTLIHALDYDDVYAPASLHLTSVIVPTVLAAAEQARATGAHTLTAIIMGIEVAARLGLASRKRRRSQAFLPTTLDGSFGATAAGARLLGMSIDQSVHAMGINYAQLAGNRQALLDMSLTKRIQPALAARSVMWSLALARRGITGPHRALEGQAGYVTAYLDGNLPTPEELSEPRANLLVEDVAVKQYCSCGACHPVQQAAEELLREDHLKPEEIRRIQLFGCGPGGLVGHPFCMGDHPQVQAQFSAAYGVALTLLRGPARLEQMQENAIRGDNDVARLAETIEFVQPPSDLPERQISRPPEFSDYSVRPHGIIVTTKDGRRLIRTRCPAETFAPGRLTLDAVLPKFRDCARYAGDHTPEQVQDIVQAVQSLKEAPSLAHLLSALAPDQPNATQDP